jgi:hypothetical protein
MFVRFYDINQYILDELEKLTESDNADKSNQNNDEASNFTHYDLSPGLVLSNFT